MISIKTLFSLYIGYITGFFIIDVLIYEHYSDFINSFIDLTVFSSILFFYRDKK